MKNDGMDEMNIREYLENHKLLTDGAMGTYFDTVEKENYIMFLPVFRLHCYILRHQSEAI